MELKAIAAAQKLLFIKCSHSGAGDLHQSVELRCRFIKKEERLLHLTGLMHWETISQMSAVKLCPLITFAYLTSYFC